MKKVHYPNLNSLRFIAFFMVLIHHTEQVKSICGLDSILETSLFVQLIGKIGVALFFVLSGFLITSLLFIEKDTYKQVSVKSFILRRLFRIWPVYFLMVIVSFFFLPLFSITQLGNPYVNVSNHFWLNMLLYVAFLPHFQIIFLGPILGCSQAWSIGIEEQFYLFWPFLIKYFTSRQIVKGIVIFIVAYVFVALVLKYEAHKLLNQHSIFANKMSDFSVLIGQTLKFDCLFIGCLFAYINLKIVKDSFWVSKWAQGFFYMASAFITIKGYSFWGYYWEIHSLLYGFIIINLVRAETSLINIEWKFLSYLGKISYGMYMYHILIITVAVKLLVQINAFYMLYPVVIVSTVAISALSYEFFEKYFLRKKEAYAKIASG